MRKLLISLLMASAITTPAWAGPRDREDREQAREERQQARQNRHQSDDSTSTTDAQSNQSRQSYQARPDRTDRPDRQPREDRSFNRNNPNTGGAPNQQIQYQQHQQHQQIQREQVRPQVQQQPMRVRPTDRQTFDRSQVVQDRQIRQDMFQQRREQRADNRDAARQARIERQQAMKNVRPPVVSTRPAPNTQPPLPSTVRPSTVPTYRWSSNNWRHDKRYDWYNYRNKYWWLFQLGSYYDPFGWGYQPYQVGWRMWPSYYSDNYWINDPWYYRLPYAPPGTRWVRYWDDAVLVDTWSGQVVDVIYNFFW